MMRQPLRPRPLLPVLLGSMMGLGMVACGDRSETPATPATPPEAAPQPQAPAAADQPAPATQSNSASPSVPAGTSAEALRDSAQKALREQRMYAPAGNNAVEYYLALRERRPNDPSVASALSDLMPYARIGAEQSINREDYAEAERMLTLLQQMDPNAPALSRLRSAIDDGKAAVAQRALDAEEAARREEQLAREREAEQQRAQEEAARQLAATEEAERQAAEQRAAEQRAAEQRAAEQRAAEQRAAEQRAAEQRAAEQRAAEQRAAEQREREQAAAAPVVRAISTPAPEFPASALRDGQSGEVVVEFTVNTDGTVGNMRVVSSSPPRIFDRAATSAVRRWRFQPVSEPVTTRRNIAFQLPTE